MNKKIKYLIISSIAFIFLITFSFVLGYFNSIKPKEVVYPDGGLSDSIFDSQNTEYISNESFPSNKEMIQIPYMYDAPNVEAAVVDQGNVFKLSDTYFLYVTEYSKQANLDGIIGHELGTVMNLNLDESQTVITNLKEDMGFINGYETNYEIKKIYVTDGIIPSMAYLVGYNLIVPEGNENVFIAVASTENTNDAYNNMKTIANSAMYTFRYSTNVAEKLEKKKNEKIQEEAAEKEKSDAALQAELEAQKKAEQEQQVVSNKTKNMGVKLDKNYNNLQLYIYWSNPINTPELTLYNADSSLTYRPSSLKNGEAKFEIGQADAGTWILKVVGEDYGECSMKKVEAFEESNNDVEENVSSDSSQNYSEDTDENVKIQYNSTSGPVANYAIPGQSRYVNN